MICCAAQESRRLRWEWEEKTVTGSHGIAVTCDLAIEDASSDGLQMVVLPGGMPGAANLYASQRVQELIRYAADHDLWVAANCASPVVVLGAMGLLAGRRYTCYPTMAGELEDVHYMDAPVVIDGRIITARGPGASNPFSVSLIEVLTSREKANAVAAAYQLRP